MVRRQEEESGEHEELRVKEDAEKEHMIDERVECVEQEWTSVE